MRLAGSVRAAAAAVLALGPAVGLGQDSSAAATIARNERAAVSDLRVIISGEAAYQSTNQGWYDNLGCLHKPSKCIPGYPADAPVFLTDEALASLRDKDGYKRKFHALAPETDRDTQKTSPSSLALYAVTMVPITPGKTGQRGFCGDASGVICFTQDGSEPKPTQGVCPAFAEEGKPAGCEPMR